MFRLLNLRSFFVFLGRNKLYTAVNIFGLSLSLMFVVLIADYTTRQLTTDRFHTKADRIAILSSEIYPSTAYYLQKHLLDRYPEIESTCAVVPSGWSTSDTQEVVIGTRKFAATVLYADSTFFAMFDFPLVEGDRKQVFAACDQIVLSESFARKAFGTFNPVGQVIRYSWDESDADAKSYVVSGIAKDLDNSVIPNRDIIMRAERITEINESNNEQLGNAGAVTTFVLVREGADLRAKIPDMVTYFKEFYWPYQGNSSKEVLLTPLTEFFFSDLIQDSPLNHGSWSFVLILIAVGLVILIFAVVNYINLTVAQTGFRAREMAMRRLLGSSRMEVVLKLVFESMLLCAVAFVIAFGLAYAVEPYASRLLGARIDVMAGLGWNTTAAYLLLIVVLGVVSGISPAVVISRYKPLDVMNGSLRRRTKMIYSNVLITFQHVITVLLLVSSLTITLQIRHMVGAPLGYNTRDILVVPTNLFRDYGEIRQFRSALVQQPVVEAVALGCGTPHNGGNNNTMPYGPDRMVSFQIFTGDSVYFRMLGLEVLRDNHNPQAQWLLNEQAFREMEISQDAPNFKAGSDLSWTWDIAGIVRDFQIRSALDKPRAVMIRNIGDFDGHYKDGQLEIDYPWEILVKTRGDQVAAFDAVKSVYGTMKDAAFFNAQYLETDIARDYDEQRRLLRIVGIFTLIALLISGLGMLAMSTYYIQQKQQEVAVRKVFGATGGEVLGRLLGHFMRLVCLAFVVAIPIGWYVMSRWLEEYSVRIALSPLIFLAAGAFTILVALAVVWRQSRVAANANPVKSIKN